jgi:hypothetical protein
VTVTLQGEVTGWGDNSYGQSARMDGITNFVAVAAGGLHTLGLREDGIVVAWGDNFYGQTNVPAGLTNIFAIAAGNAHSVALRDNGAVAAWGSNFYGQTNVPAAATNIVGIAAGAYHNLALKSNGTILGWGDTNFGALNIPADLSNVVQVAAGDGLSYALLSNGTVRSWGSGGFGAVSIPTNLTNVVQIDAGWTHLLALKSDGTAVGLGLDSGWGETTPPVGMSNVLQVSGGYLFSTALLNDGSVRAWGRYDYGQTNVPTGLGDTKQIAAGGFHCLALAYSPVLNYPVAVPQDVLLVYNATSAGSVAVANYYLQNRPKFSQANFIGLSCTNGEILARTDFTNQVLNPVVQWLTQQPTKRPAYLVFSYGLPWRFEHSDTDTNLAGSIAYELRRRLPYRAPFVSHLNMATTNDCLDYIDKLAAFGAYLPLNRVLIRASDAGYGSETFVLDNIRNASFTNFSTLLRNARDGLVTLGVQTNAIPYADNWAGIYYTDNWPPNTNHIRDATNVAAYVCWGVHSFWPATWPIADAGDDFPYIAFHGNSAWHITQSIESYNGYGLAFASQSSFQMWFSAAAFGGTNYENTAVGAVSHVDEPYLPGVSDTAKYFALWFSGKSFGISAWASTRPAPVFGVFFGPEAVRIQATGDPLVAK